MWRKPHPSAAQYRTVHDLCAEEESARAPETCDLAWPNGSGSHHVRSDELADSRKLLKEDRILIIYGLDDPGSIFGALSWDAVEFNREAVLFLPMPGAPRTMESEVQAKAGERGLYLFDILLLGENAIHGLVLLLLRQLNAAVSIDSA